MTLVFPRDCWPLVISLTTLLLSERVNAQPANEAVNSGSSKALAWILLSFQTGTLVLQPVVWAIEVLYVHGSVSTSRLPPFRSRPVRRGLIALIPLCWSFNFAAFLAKVLIDPMHTIPTCQNLSIDQDAAGIGARVALYLSGGLSTFMAGLGHFHSEPSGVLEFGLILWLSLFTALVNLVKSHLIASDPVNILLETAMLDAYISALSMTLAMKECVAEKWRVICTLLVQGSGIVTETVVISKIAQGQSIQRPGSDYAECRCFEMIWWGQINTCRGASPGFWLYLSLRTLSWFQEAWLALCHSGHYSQAKSARNDSNATQNTYNDVSPCVYDSVPATAFSHYIVPVFSFIGTCLSIEVFIRAHRQQDDAPLKSWGQTAQFIAALWTIYRWIQQIYQMFTIKRVINRRAVLDRCCTGSRVPVLGSTDALDPHLSIRKQILAQLRRLIRNHPFGNLPPRRRSDHARFCDFQEGWSKIELDFRQWPYATNDDKGLLLLDGARRGDITLVSDLLKEAAPVNFIDPGGCTPLWLAVHMDHFSIVSLLLEHGADPNVSDETRTTPLHIASERGHEEVAKRLIRKGANPCLTDLEGQTALHAAARHGQPKMVNLLILSGVDANIQDNKGRTGLHLLLRHGHDHMVDFFAGKCDPNVINRKGKTPLYLAARYERVDATRALLKYHPNSEISDIARGWTPLHVCARYDRPEVARLLLEYGCDSNVIAKEEKRTALHMAVNYGREKVVDHLLHYGAGLDAVDYKNRTALFFGAKDDRDATRKLLHKGARPDLGQTSMLHDLLVQYGATDNEAKHLISTADNKEILDVLQRT